MKKKFSVEQILSVLKQAEVGVPIAELIRKGGDQRADVLSLEVEVRRLGSGSSYACASGRSLRPGCAMATA